MNKPLHAAREAACQIRFGQVGLAQLRIRTTDTDALLSELTARIAAAPQLFERAAICLARGTHEQQADAIRAVSSLSCASVQRILTPC